MGLGFFQFDQLLKFNEKTMGVGLYIDQIKEDEEDLHVIMGKEGSLVNNKF